MELVVIYFKALFLLVPEGIEENYETGHARTTGLLTDSQTGDVNIFWLTCWTFRSHNLNLPEVQGFKPR
jgi:hypothetical protein